jgi:magnesium transporter
MNKKAHSTSSYQPDTAGSVMATTLLTATMDTTVAVLIKRLSTEVWDDIHFAYLIDNNKKLIGQVALPDLIKANPQATLGSLRQPVKEHLSPHSDTKRAVFLSLKNDMDAVPVVDNKGILLGAITAKTIIDTMHNEHLESLLIATGIRRSGQSIVELATAQLWHVLVTRAPWLLVGALAGIALGFISSQFEASLEKSIALAYFIPVVAYIADSVGTQSEAITIRALAVIRLNYLTYLTREIVIGFVLGIVLGAIGALGALIISQSLSVALVVGLSLLTASTMATSLAALIPIIFKLLGKDPALGSGPIATAVQDMVSVLIYFLFALLIIH